MSSDERVNPKRQRLSLKGWKRFRQSSLDGTLIENPESPATKESGDVSKSSTDSNEDEKRDPVKPKRTESSTLKDTPVFASFFNLGNTCFLNSILYVLRFTPRFLCHLHHLCQLINVIEEVSMKHSEIPLKWKLIQELHEVFVEARKLEYRIDDFRGKDIVDDFAEGNLTIQPTEFLAVLQKLNPIFKGNAQHDVHELLCWLLNMLQEVEQEVTVHAKTSGQSTKENIPAQESGNQNSKESTPEHSNGVCHNNSNNHAVQVTSDMFQGAMQIQTRCAECENVTVSNETFLNIGISLEHLTNNEADPPMMFHDAILKAHILQGDDKYWCESCYHHNEARRTVHFQHLPSTLIIHLERFSSDISCGVSKITRYVPTPIKLGCFVEHGNQSCNNIDHCYCLHGVISHSGISLSSGHYTAAVRTKYQHHSDAGCLDKFIMQQFDDLRSSVGKQSTRSRKRPKFEDEMEGMKRITRNSPKNDTREMVKPSCSHIDCCNPLFNRLQKLKWTSDASSVWIECDDDKQSCINENGLITLFSEGTSKVSNSTPYLLLYASM